jgi:DNA (cytosine-5)-methyltransferase 1
VADGLPAWLDGHWLVEPDIPRTAKGVKDRVNRLKALGNAVIPAQAYPIFKAIADSETELTG